MLVMIAIVQTIWYECSLAVIKRKRKEIFMKKTVARKAFAAASALIMCGNTMAFQERARAAQQHLNSR